MIKWLFLFSLAAIFYLWLKGKKQVQFDSEQANKASAKQAKIPDPEVMVQCQYCSVHLPKSDAIAREKCFYCSQAHLQSLDATGWLGSAAWRLSPNQDSRPQGVDPDLLVIHHISLPPGGFVDRNCTGFIVDFFQNKLDSSLHPYFQEIAEQKVSSHFLISRQGEVFQFVSTQNKAWHAGLSSFFGREKCNDFSIGVELEGDSDHPFEDIQYQALAKLTSELQAIYPNLHFAGHSDIAPGRKTDPGIQFDWEKFQAKADISVDKLPFGLHSR
ncbi:1,6-anhydro-N-acetylmuramyl-L-alanine amidase AmpD [Polynucleobacter sp. AP-Nino-20-G2]|uniref:1,6-anhydro-N-acetylmuramyl-L-alanine amidase AmpD n=1 Tax=Polynucleobacter sp. AP-Nino-20-G2 TaxID=2576917 RepID=UPI0021125A3B|nr:1,6-anhydro-N-acetylmuramyl-L-alanine amidase AmpD [Polynucleobacter sp. AP-Nino-20-G2]